MAPYTFIVLTNPVEGHDDAYNEWYDRTHLPDVLGVEGVVSAKRFRLADGDGSTSPWRYLAIYEWDVDDVPTARAALARAREAGTLPISPALDRSRTGAWFFEPIDPG